MGLRSGKCSRPRVVTGWPSWPRPSRTGVRSSWPRSWPGWVRGTSIRGRARTRLKRPRRCAGVRATGRWHTQWPRGWRVPRDLEADGLLVVNPDAPAAPVAGLSLRWIAVDLECRRSIAVPRAGRPDPRRDAFVSPLELELLDGNGLGDLSLGLVLPCWTLLGMLDRALELTCDYVLQRRQFGQPLATFQGVQFQLTDAEVERVGLEELAKYALWSIECDDPAALSDALALRAAAVQAAEIVFRVAHQLHGAIGFCDETALSWVSRASVPLRRLPFGTSGSRTHLARSLGRQALPGLFNLAAVQARPR